MTNFDFQNGPDSVVLRDDVAVIDAVGYGDFSGGAIFAGEGTPAEDAPAGSSLERFFADVDTDDNFADFGIQGVPTPGAGVTSVPEPAPTLLVSTGLGMLAWFGRRPRRVRA